MMMRGRMTASRPGHAMCAKLITALWESPASFQIIEEGAAAGHSDAGHSDGYALPEVAAAAAV